MLLCACCVFIYIIYSVKKSHEENIFNHKNYSCILDISSIIIYLHFILLQIEQYFRQVAAKSKTEKEDGDLEMKLSSNKKRVLYMMPLEDVDVFVSSSLFPSIKELYPEHDLYVTSRPEFLPFISSHDCVHKVLIHDNTFDNINLLKDKDGNDLFETIYTPHLNKNNFEKITKTNL